MNGDQKKGRDTLQRYLHLFVIVILGFLIYSNTLHSPFVFDDAEVIVDNYKIVNFRFLDFSGTRYIGFLSFALNYAVGGLDTFGYHAVNIAIHIANSIFVYFLVFSTFHIRMVQSEKEQNSFRGQIEAVAFTAALLFVSHPAQTQAVTYLSQRFASLATFFYLGSILCYAGARLAFSLADRERVWRPWLLYAVSIISAALAAKTKEISFTLPAVIVLYEFTFLDSSRERLLKRFLYLAPFLLSLLVIPLTLFYAARAAGPAGSAGSMALFDKLSGIMTESQATLGRFDYLMTQLKVIVTYLRLLVLPVNQNLDYDYPVFHSFYNTQVILSFIFLSSIFLFAVFLYVRSKYTESFKGIFTAFGILWFFITLSVESSIIPIVDVIFEHRLYLPSVGMFSAFAALLIYIRERFGLKRAVPAVIAVIVALSSAATFYRNRVWKDELTLWKDVVAKSPNKARGYSNVGYAVAREGRFAEAEEYFKKVVRLEPGMWVGYVNLGETLVRLNRHDEALKNFYKAAQLHPEHAWKAHYNIGDALLLLDRNAEAAEQFRKALSIKPDYFDAYVGLGYALSLLGRNDEALMALDTALKLRPDSPEANNGMGNVLRRLGRLDEAIAFYQKTLQLQPNHKEAEVNMEEAIRLKDRKVHPKGS
ncbi:MAG: tetratricopeptide repeat protein [Deltaproteobacteria bacterium]|nr:tetratricopeptide repeat protein [Deltaproteobacteria bacterium]